MNAKAKWLCAATFIIGFATAGMIQEMRISEIYRNEAIVRKVQPLYEAHLKLMGEK